MCNGPPFFSKISIGVSFLGLVRIEQIAFTKEVQDVDGYAICLRTGWFANKMRIQS
jgi:hypothetical protein